MFSTVVSSTIPAQVPSPWSVSATGGNSVPCPTGRTSTAVAGALTSTVTSSVSPPVVDTAVASAAPNGGLRTTDNMSATTTGIP